MYSTCLFCTKHLGFNEVVEAFPVGRRIAFDAERGRLWAVSSHWLLELAWEEAKEVAGIADSLALPSDVEDRFREMEEEIKGR